jgi:Flp pilus assembly pilin Flp
MRVLRRLLTCEQGQDLVEYSLLIAFVTFSSTALMINSGVSVSTVWTATNVALTGQSTSGTTTSSGSTTTPSGGTTTTSSGGSVTNTGGTTTTSGGFGGDHHDRH